MSLSAFLDEWLPSLRSTVRPSTYATYATYETVVNSYIKKHIGPLRLQAITPLTLKTLVSQTLVVVSGYDVQYSEPKTAEGRRNRARFAGTRCAERAGRGNASSVRYG